MNIPVGNRFQASLSPNRKYVDIKDRKDKGGLTMMGLDEVEALHGEVARVVQNYSRPFDIKLLQRSTRHVIKGLNEEDGRELLELFATLEDSMVPASA